MEKVEAINLYNNKGKQIIPQEENKQPIKKRDLFWKSMILLGVINVILTLLNIEKYFINVDKDEEVHNITL